MLQDTFRQIFRTANPVFWDSRLEAQPVLDKTRERTDHPPLPSRDFAFYISAHSYIAWDRSLRYFGGPAGLTSLKEARVLSLGQLSFASHQ